MNRGYRTFRRLSFVQGVQTKQRRRINKKQSKPPSLGPHENADHSRIYWLDPEFKNTIIRI